ncbi:MAG: hypothetical protein IT196_12305 [Acidimicrobiales bacterium]|nr:hypothetical protein [Acidimicrobiales bacterium]
MVVQLGQLTDIASQLVHPGGELVQLLVQRGVLQPAHPTVAPELSAVGASQEHDAHQHECRHADGDGARRGEVAVDPSTEPGPDCTVGRLLRAEQKSKHETPRVVDAARATPIEPNDATADRDRSVTVPTK